MNLRIILGAVILAGLLSSSAANAWFIFIPTGAIRKAMETDPATVAVSPADRSLGQCAGLHVNQARKGMGNADTYGDERYQSGPPRTSTTSPESKFHSDIADFALLRATDKDKVKSVAEAYSVRWSRVAGADRQANLQYGANLVRGCRQNDLPVRFTEFTAWQARQEEKKKQPAADESRPVDTASSEQKATPVSLSTPGVDYIAEAKKSARILGCPPGDVTVTGKENDNVLVSANCGTGPLLLLTCDQSGVCLRR